uniref:Methionine aminopeptidase n=1 Tax=Theileria parva TaxID=5875 RepID=Q4N1G9_THEPA|eukprot:XP_764406.1 methionine aminopeptidase, type I [Theileria parva strain Muguga]
MTVKISKYFMKNSFLTPKLVLEKICPNLANKNGLKSQKNFKQTVRYGEYPVLSHDPIPSHIPRPYYAQNRTEDELKIYYNQKLPFAEVKNEEQISKMRAAAKIAAKCLKLCLDSTEKGVTADFVDRKAQDFIVSSGAYPSGVNFHGYPRAICVSVNEVACHGIPNMRPFHESDVVSYDCTVFYDGFFGDCAATCIVGEAPEEIKKLVLVSKECCYVAIDSLKPGVKFSKLAKLVSNHAEKNGFSVIKEFGGHFIGHVLHMPPMMQFSHPSSTPGVAEEGHVFTIGTFVSFIII